MEILYVSSVHNSMINHVIKVFEENKIIEDIKKYKEFFCDNTKDNSIKEIFDSIKNSNNINYRYN